MFERGFHLYCLGESCTDDVFFKAFEQNSLVRHPLDLFQRDYTEALNS